MNDEATMIKYTEPTELPAVFVLIFRIDGGPWKAGSCMPTMHGAHEVASGLNARENSRVEWRVAEYAPIPF